jgi:hypothetical protein
VAINRETTIYEIKLTGGRAAAAEANAAAASMDRLKASARATSIPVGGGAAGALSTEQYIANTEAQIAAMRTQAAGLSTRAAANVAAVEQQAAAAAATARRRPAFGERGRAVAAAVGAGRFASLATPFGGWGPLAAIAGGFTAINQIKAGAQNIALNQQLQAQTIAGIRSTGGAANVTAKHIDALAESYVKLYGYQNEAAQQGSNVLLTFTNIRNEAGKNNKIFDQTSTAVANVAARMGTSIPEAALQLGKAINEPIKGVGALRRIGVQFTNQQVDQIKVMTAAGNRMGAQKIVLQELNKEFGGSATAHGRGYAAAWVRLTEAWENARNRLVIKLLPAMTRATNWLSKELPVAANTASRAWDKLFNSPKQPHSGPGSSGLMNWLTTDHSFDQGLRDIAGIAPHNKTLSDPVFAAKDAIFGSPEDKWKAALALKRNPNDAAARAVLFGQKDITGSRGLGQPFDAPSPVRVNWNPTDPLDSRPIYLVAVEGGRPLAQLVTNAQQKRAHAEGRGSAHR